MIIFEGLDEALKNRIQAGDEAAESELYEVMRKALIRMVDPDTLHDAYVAALVACRRGDVESVGGYVFRSLWYMRCKKIREYLNRKSLRSSCKSVAKKKKISMLDDDHQVEYSIMIDPRAEQESMGRSIVLDELLSVLGSKGNTWKRGDNISGSIQQLIWDAEITDLTAGTITTTRNTSNGTTVTCPASGNTLFQVRVRGTVGMSADGTFAIQAAENSASGTLTIQRGSYGFARLTP